MFKRKRKDADDHEDRFIVVGDDEFTDEDADDYAEDAYPEDDDEDETEEEDRIPVPGAPTPHAAPAPDGLRTTPGEPPEEDDDDLDDDGDPEDDDDIDEDDDLDEDDDAEDSGGIPSGDTPSDDEPTAEDTEPASDEPLLVIAAPDGSETKIPRFRRKGKKDKPEKKAKVKEPRDPDSGLERLRRWWLRNFKGYVNLVTITRDPRYAEFVSDTTLVHRRELPRTAVAVTNKRRTYADDKIFMTDWWLSEQATCPDDWMARQFTASDAYLYMVTNKLDNALTLNWTDMSHIDFKKYFLLGAIAIMVVVLFFMLR
jgi:hypothetical protein